MLPDAKPASQELYASPADLGDPQVSILKPPSQPSTAHPPQRWLLLGQQGLFSAVERPRLSRIKDQPVVLAKSLLSRLPSPRRSEEKMRQLPYLVAKKTSGAKTQRPMVASQDRASYSRQHWCGFGSSGPLGNVMDHSHTQRKDTQVPRDGIYV